VTSDIRVEFHCHSSASDGELAPERVAEELACAGVQWAALTDHETTRGQERFRQALEREGIRSMPGAEVIALSPEGALHLLAYGFDPRNAEFQRMLQALRTPMLAYASHCILRAWTAGRGFVRRNGKSESPPRPPSPPYPASHVRGLIDAKEAIAIIHGAGGRAYLAHPLTGMDDPSRLEPLVVHLAAEGLDGIEALYKPYPSETCQALIELAQRHSLSVSAGSDYHGPHIPGATDPGVEMPVLLWERFASDVGLSGAANPAAGRLNGT